MSGRAIITGETVPALPKHVRLRQDPRRGWVVLAPERVLIPDEIAVEILHRCDGRSTVDDISAALAQEFSAPEDQIRDDVIGVLQNLADKGFLAT